MTNRTKHPAYFRSESLPPSVDCDNDNENHSQLTRAARDQDNVSAQRVRRVVADASAKGSGRILDKMREITERQLNRLAERSQHELLTPPEGNLLYKLAQTYQIMEHGTQLQVKNLDLTGYTDAQLDAVEREARALVASNKDTGGSGKR